MIKNYLFALASILLVAFVIYQFDTDAITDPTVTIPEVIEEPVVENLLFGISLDSFNIQKGTIRLGRNLAYYLYPHGITDNQLYKSQIAAKDVFDIRKINANKEYTLFLDKQTDTLKYFVYEHSLTDYYVFGFNDTVTVTHGEVETKILEKSMYGKIETSLWNSFVDAGSNPILSGELSHIYAWTIDFFGLNKGDEFKVVYKEEFVRDTVSVGIKSISYAWFKHYKSEYYAIPFMQDSVVSFYDSNGESLRKAFLKSPLKFSRISSGFSNNRFHPVLRIYRPHHGIDYAAPSGTNVHSIGDGTIIKRGYQKRGGGNYLKIKHNSVYTTTYMHLRGFAKGMTVGTRVTQGEVIGYVGATGLATGPHLDFRVHKNGRPINPLKVKAPPVKPVLEENIPQFSIVRDSICTLLNNVR